MNSARGFTLLEVLLALFVLAISMTTLLSTVTENVIALQREKALAEASQLAEERARQIVADTQAGLVPELGVTDGVFDDPDLEPEDQLHWQVTVDPFTIPLAGGDAAERATSTIFAESSTAPGAARPSVRVVSVRVFREADGPESAYPFVVLAVEPLSPAALATAGALVPGEEAEEAE